ncbi:hypothetical protein [Microbacterium excoecariae]|uniref:hypothetical protein n=1 Tax=Microbacterium excoecariae TaxID=2715210 RepID=UPI00140D9565|nr:hypothetical protein [Microbacterium excoecariae]NHI16387.1 hypothetical protein [Microbacterium excoecariae]
MAPSPVSSNPIMRSVLVWSAIACAVILVGAAGIGFAVAGSAGLLSGLAGAVIGFAFPALSAASILFANRYFGSPNYPVIFFGVFMGVFLLKLVVLIVALNVLFGMGWVVPGVLYGALVAAAVASLVADVIVIAKMRIPAASDVSLPGDEDDRA